MSILLKGGISRGDGRRFGAAVLLAILVLAVTVVAALVPGLLTPKSPTLIDPAHASLGPSSKYLLGTDSLGRDVLSRVIAGTRSAMVAAFVVAAGSVALATLFALLGGFLGGVVDVVISRLADMVFSLPTLLVVIVVVGILGASYPLAVAVLVVALCPAGIRTLRGEVISRRNLPYIEAAQNLGLSRWKLIIRHMLPNLEPMIVTTFFLAFTYGMVDLAGLSFLGLGAAPGSADWGRMIAENRPSIFLNQWATLAPGIVLVVVVVSANIVGESAYRHLELRRRAR